MQQKLVRLLNNKQINRISKTNFIYKNMYHNHYFSFPSSSAGCLFERMARWCPLQKHVLWHTLLLYLCLFLSLSVCLSQKHTDTNTQTQSPGGYHTIHYPISFYWLQPQTVEAKIPTCLLRDLILTCCSPRGTTERERRRENKGKDQWFYFSLVSINHSTTISLMENPN